jgi:hypothetical protein
VSQNVFTTFGNMQVNQAKYALAHWDEMKFADRGWNRAELEAAVEAAEGKSDYQI